MCNDLCIIRKTSEVGTTNSQPQQIGSAMEHQTCTYEQPQMDVIVTDGGVTTDDFGINIATSVIEGNPEGGIF